jgi:hypothetical protein
MSRRYDTLVDQLSSEVERIDAEMAHLGKVRKAVVATLHEAAVLADLTAPQGRGHTRRQSVLDDLDDVDESLTGLPLRDRLVVVLPFEGGHPVSEVARMVGCANTERVRGSLRSLERQGIAVSERRRWRRVPQEGESRADLRSVEASAETRLVAGSTDGSVLSG